MAETEHVPERPGRPARIDRHRIAAPGAEPTSGDAAAPASAVGPPAAAARVPAYAAVVPHGRDVSPAVADKTGDAVRRPALLSDRCLGCGAPTKGRAGMVTELVEVGPIRALRVVTCSACPERRRRGTGL